MFTYQSLLAAQAERQAVNTKVQGSAADIAKKAMVMIEKKIQNEFPNIPIMLEKIEPKRKLRNSNDLSSSRGGYLILQLHDELIYEVQLLIHFSRLIVQLFINIL